MAMTNWEWLLSHGRGENKVLLVENSSVRSFLKSLFEEACHLTNHRICCNLPDWLWEFPLGKPRRDDTNWLENSAAGAVWDVFQKVHNWFVDKQVTIAEFPVTKEWAIQHGLLTDPDDDFIWDDEDKVDTVLFDTVDDIIAIMDKNNAEDEEPSP